MQWNFFVFGVNRWQVYIFFSLSAFGLGWTKLTLAKQRFHFFLRGWVFFNQHSSCDSIWSPNENPWQKRLTGRELLFLPFRRNKSLRSGQQNTLWLSVITALSGSLGCWTAQGMQQDWCEFGMQNIARCYEKCQREWPVALPSLPWEWGEKDGSALGEGVVVLPTTWWFPMNVFFGGFWKLTCFGVWIWYVFSTSFEDVETGYLNLPNPEHCTISGERW